jgi:hypothetical protein
LRRDLASSLLQCVGQFMCKKMVSRLCAWLVLSGAEVDILPDRKCAGVDVVRGVSGICIVVNAHATEVCAERRFHVSSVRILQALAATTLDHLGHTRRQTRAAGTRIRHLEDTVELRVPYGSLQCPERLRSSCGADGSIGAPVAVGASTSVALTHPVNGHSFRHHYETSVKKAWRPSSSGRNRRASQAY